MMDFDEHSVEKSCYYLFFVLKKDVISYIGKIMKWKLNGGFNNLYIIESNTNQSQWNVNLNA